MKATVATDEKGRTLWAGAFRPGRVHDQTALRTEGIAGLCERYPEVKGKVDAGYRGLARQFPGQAEAPPLKLKKDAAPRKKPQRTGNSAVGSHRNGSASGTRTPGTSTGSPSSGTPGDESTSKRPSWRSPDWSPTAPPHGNHQPTRQASTAHR